MVEGGAERALLEARGLTVERGGRAVLRGLDVALASGEVLGVIGPNGAGKTTLLRCLAGLQAPASGEVLLEGRSIQMVPRRELARTVAYSPQETEDRFGFTVRQAVLMGRHPWLPRFGPTPDEEWEGVGAALAALDLEGLAERRVTELSGGEKRRVALARTLAQGGRAVLLDEPAAGLDIRHAILALRVFARRASRDGAGVAVVLHDLNLAAMFCGRLLLLQEGGAAACGPVAEVLTEENIARVFGVRSRMDGGHVRFLEA
ncbi:ABC transporter ATP-binding protein [Fundidesulfovibrio agrisoli]|uniref:ABC transporter ATP-binding protein n=1 Tax=Fundidesulfovibrio agrisoli TaxID=2922717 RepID=UPI001FAC4C5B|nr:ABC transporter ATP-binding protein [Fundidesulfovibrio agrisoli]